MIVVADTGSFLPISTGYFCTMVRFLSVRRQNINPKLSTATNTRKAINTPRTVKSVS